MMSHPPALVESLLRAVSFASRRHNGQLRKDGRTPYVSPVFRVCLVMRHVFGVDDVSALTAALLHDTIEDTTTDFDDLSEEFGSEVASWVAALSKDTRLPDEERERRYVEAIAVAPWQVQVCKLADIYDNLLDTTKQQTADQLRRSCRRARYYIDGLEPHLAEQARKSVELVKVVLQEQEAKSSNAASAGSFSDAS